MAERPRFSEATKAALRKVIEGMFGGMLSSDVEDVASLAEKLLEDLEGWVRFQEKAETPYANVLWALPIALIIAAVAANETNREANDSHSWSQKELGEFALAAKKLIQASMEGAEVSSSQT